MAEETKVIVQREETQAAQKAKETQAIADDAQRDLNEALPALVHYILYYTKGVKGLKKLQGGLTLSFGTLKNIFFPFDYILLIIYLFI